MTDTTERRILTGLLYAGTFAYMGVSFYTDPLPVAIRNAVFATALLLVVTWTTTTLRFTRNELIETRAREEAYIADRAEQRKFMQETTATIRGLATSSEDVTK